MVTVGRGVPASTSRRRLSVRTMGAASGRGCAALEPVLTHAQPRDSARSELREVPSPAGPHGGSTAPRSAGDLVRSRSPGDHADGAAATRAPRLRQPSLAIATVAPRPPRSSKPCRGWARHLHCLDVLPRESVHGLRGSEPGKYIRFWWLDGPHTLDTLEGFSRPEPAAHRPDQPDEAPQAAHLTPVGT